MPDPDLQHVTIEDGGRVIAEALVGADPEHHVVNATLHVEAGHLPPGTRTRLVDAVLDSPAAPPGTHLEATLPAGDAEMLERIRDRCIDVEIRSAGASVLLEGDIPRS